MESAGVAKRLEASTYFDCEGNAVSKKEFANGQKCEYVLIHPELGLLFDKVGSNKAQLGDGLAGKKIIVGRKGEKKKNQSPATTSTTPSLQLRHSPARHSCVS